jgi:hypothetical protein
MEGIVNIGIAWIWLAFGDASMLSAPLPEASELRKKLGMESAGGVCLWEATI